MEKITEMPSRTREERNLPPRQARTPRRQLPGGATASKPVASPGTTRVSGRDYRPRLNDLFQTMSVAGGMMPVKPLQAQSALISMHATQLAEGINVAAHSNKFVQSGVEWLCGKDEADAGGAGIIIALAALAPFVYTSIQLWSPPKKGTPEYAQYEASVGALADQAEANSRAFIQAAMEQFQQAQAAEEAARSAPEAEAAG